MHKIMKITKFKFNEIIPNLMISEEFYSSSKSDLYTYEYLFSNLSFKYLSLTGK